MNTLVIVGLFGSLAISSGTEQDDGPASVATATVVQELTLDQYVRRVLASDLDLQLAVVDRNIAQQGIREALGFFDPELFTRVSGSDDEIPTAFAFQAEKNQTFDANLGLRGQLRSGARYDLTYLFNYQRQSPQNAFSSLNPTFTSAVVLNFTQPLLRGAGTTVADAPVERARLVFQQGNYDLVDKVQNKAFEAVGAYWNFVANLRRLETAKEALEVARELVGNNRRKLDAGIMTRIDVITAQAEAARREEDLIVAQSQASEAEDLLKKLMNPGEDLVAWSQSYRPITEPDLRQVELVDESTAVEDAFQHRGDLQSLEAELRKSDLDLAVAENQLLPQLDAFGGYGLSGLSGESSDPNITAETDDNNYDNLIKSTRAIRRGDFIRWNAGLDWSYPIGNRTASASLEQARLQKDRAWLSWRILRMSIVEQLRIARRRVKDGWARTQAAMQSRILAQEQYQAEQVRLDNQASTTFQVREAQRDLFQALDLETSALTDYEIILAQLAQTQGLLAQAYGVSWVEPEPLEGALVE